MDSDSEIPAFSRTNRVGDEVGELRVNVPKWLLAVLDGMAIAETNEKGTLVSRTDIVFNILSKKALQKFDESMLIHRITKDYPTLLELQGKSHD